MPVTRRLLAYYYGKPAPHCSQRMVIGSFHMEDARVWLHAKFASSYDRFAMIMHMNEANLHWAVSTVSLSNLKHLPAVRSVIEVIAPGGSTFV